MSQEQVTGTVYEFVVNGELSDRFAFHFDGLELQRRDGTTVLTGSLLDQAQVAGVMAQILELGLELISVRQPQRNDQAVGTAAPTTG